jgi:nuclear mRNA export protein PCID2/THP1
VLCIYVWCCRPAGSLTVCCVYCVPTVLIKYELYEFAALSDSLRQGDMKKFNNVMTTYEHRFISQGTYLLLERCRTLCYRNLLKRIAFVGESHILSLDTIIYTFSWLDMRVDTDEAECIIANLIYNKMVRGYIHHSQRKVVLSKQNAFPNCAFVMHRAKQDP